MVTYLNPSPPGQGLSWCLWFGFITHLIRKNQIRFESVCFIFTSTVFHVSCSSSFSWFASTAPRVSFVYLFVGLFIFLCLFCLIVCLYLVGGTVGSVSTHLVQKENLAGAGYVSHSISSSIDTVYRWNLGSQCIELSVRTINRYAVSIEPKFTAHWTRVCSVLFTWKSIINGNYQSIRYQENLVSPCIEHAFALPYSFKNRFSIETINRYTVLIETKFTVYWTYDRFALFV